MDAKTTYSNSVLERKEEALEDQELATRIVAGEVRAKTYSENWQWVNINDVAERFALGGVPEYENGKIIYYNSDRTLRVVADVGGGYLRIQDLKRRGRRPYLDIHGRDANNYVDEHGRQHGRSQADYNAATHFRIMRRRDMR